MFALPGLLLLVFLDVLRPQEYVSALRGVPVLHLAALLTGLGILIDLRLGLTRIRWAPHLLLTSLFMVWCLATDGVRNPAGILPRFAYLLIPYILYVLVAHGAQSFKALDAIGALLLGLTLALSVVGIHQGFARTACYKVTLEDGLKWTPDGRSCTTGLDCMGEGADPGAEYDCEKVGLFGTNSVQNRVRFRGSLEDPNELALVLGISMPFAFTFYERRRSLARLVLVIATVGMVGLTTYLTQSRGGQLVFLAVLGVYFVQRVGLVRGAVAGAMLALPVLVFGGRSGASAEASTQERIECWWVGMHMFTGSPVIGVGFGNFVEHHYLTAHNSFILAAAELGYPGLFLWCAVFYVAAKIPYEILRSDLPPLAKSWGLATLASLAGLFMGVMLLSFNYKDVFWVYVALTGVLYGAVRRHEPGFVVRFGYRDILLVATGCAGLVALFIGYTGSKLGW